MASCFYYFSNGEELLRLAKEEKFDELKETFEKTELQNVSKVIPGKHAAFSVYNAILDAVKEKDSAMFRSIVEKASRMFAEVWYIMPLLNIREAKTRYGALIPEALEVLKEYDEYKSEAIKARNRNQAHDDWQEQYNEFVTFCGCKGRLSFYRHGVEYVVYYGEDKYYTEMPLKVRA